MFLPFQYACRKSNGLEMVRLLIAAGTNVQARNKETGWVPLHEAAANGNLDTVQELLALPVPHMPRTSYGELPVDLAQEKGHSAVVDFLTNYVPPPANTHKGQWYHGTLERQIAVESLRDHASKLMPSSPGKENKENDPRTDEGEHPDASGVYLVRYSTKHGVDVLTLLYENEAKHFIIQRKQNYLYIDDGPYMTSLEHLIEHYTRFSDGLQTNLRYPVPPKPKPPIPLFSTIPKTKHKVATSPGTSSPPGPVPTPSSNGTTSYFRKSSDNSLQKPPHPSAPARNLSVPNDSILQQMNKVGLFDRSPERSSTPKSSPNIDENKSKPNSSTLKKKKNIIIDGMKSLRKSRVKQKLPVEPDTQLNRDSLIEQIASDKVLQQLSFSSNFSLSTTQLEQSDAVYQSPPNNCAIVDIDFGEPLPVPSSRSIDSINNNSATPHVGSPPPHSTLDRRTSSESNVTESHPPEDYFVESDKNIYGESQLDNNNEDIYFIDAPPSTPAPNPPQVRSLALSRGHFINCINFSSRYLRWTTTIYHRNPQRRPTTSPLATFRYFLIAFPRNAHRQPVHRQHFCMPFALVVLSSGWIPIPQQLVATAFKVVIRNSSPSSSSNRTKMNDSTCDCFALRPIGQTISFPRSAFSRRRCSGGVSSGTFTKAY